MSAEQRNAIQSSTQGAGAPGHDHGDHEHPHDHPHDDHGHDHPHDDHGHDHPHDDHGHDHGEHAHVHHGGLRGMFDEVFRPHSHDSADKVDTALESSAKGIWATKVSFFFLLFTGIFQIVLVALTNSAALMADTVHHFSDAMTSIPLMIAFIVGRRVATRRYTYGYRRSEDLAGLFIVGMITLSAIIAAWESIDRIVHPQDISSLPILVAAGLIGFAGNEFAAVFRIRIGKQINSAALIADGYHARTDGFTSLAVVVGAIGVWLGFPIIDPIIGLLISIAILMILKDALKQVFGRLMDAVDPAITDKVEGIAASVDGVQAVDAVRVRWVGHRLETVLQVTVDSDLSVWDGHAIAESVRAKLMGSVKGLDAVTVHVDPCNHTGQQAHIVAQREPAPA